MQAAAILLGEAVTRVTANLPFELATSESLSGALDND